jgi:hypothetical protein
VAKRNWPDHPGIGKIVTYNGIEARVVDVKAGPALLDTSTLDQPSATITGTLRLRLALPGGEVWTPPLDGKQFVAWCEKQDATHHQEPNHGDDA